ncbi:adenylate kinase [Paroceanicella profunda]|uniref:adenylate kinase n=1 Tax=Paroceanicella profunda TaxID=2579971 RepID=UPI00197D7B90|nr:adenylate kinase [Paroceanicella profunda]
MTRRILVLGASGSGTTTLGRLLACALAVPHFDTDDFFWSPEPPRFTRRRPVEDRLALMEALFLPGPAWVLSGALDPWGDPLIDRLDHAIFLTTPDALRMPRLEARERLRYGDQGSGETEAFLAWAARYETAGFEQRSRTRHEDWINRLPCPVTRIEGSGTPGESLARALKGLGVEGPLSTLPDLIRN